MPNNGPIVLIDDDKDDQELLQSALKEVGMTNEVVIFDNTKEAFQYLLTGPQPFIIFCDINLPAENGIEFKKRIDGHKELHKKSIPFVFISTHPSKEIVEQAYENLTVQGIFRKSDTFTGLKSMLNCILEYWRICRHPND